MYFERLKPTTRAGVLSASLFATALVGCTSSVSTEAQAPLEKIVKLDEEIKESPEVVATYYSNGTRLLEYKNVPTGLVLKSIFQVCDSLDLLEQTNADGENGVAGSDRTANHPACEDGLLLAEDFEAQLPLGGN